ncbi:hypothetical protein K438DRAFT_1789387 [Mycena galopus ATCC 62051]|nr:hypothetical protein K438DRAFT_1789387 [Mycena galopus ATCC 62051]
MLKPAINKPMASNPIQPPRFNGLLLKIGLDSGGGRDEMNGAQQPRDEYSARNEEATVALTFSLRPWAEIWNATEYWGSLGLSIESQKANAVKKRRGALKPELEGWGTNVVATKAAARERYGCGGDDEGKEGRNIDAGSSFERWGAGAGAKIAAGSQAKAHRFGQLRNRAIFGRRSPRTLRKSKNMLIKPYGEGTQYVQSLFIDKSLAAQSRNKLRLAEVQITDGSAIPRVKDRGSTEEKGKAQIYGEMAQPRSHLLKERLITPATQYNVAHDK